MFVTSFSVGIFKDSFFPIPKICFAVSILYLDTLNLNAWTLLGHFHVSELTEKVKRTKP